MGVVAPPEPAVPQLQAACSRGGKGFKMHDIVYTPIGVVRSPFRKPEGAPIQPSGARGVTGRVEVREEFLAGLKDLEGFSHVVLIYHFHLSRGFALEVVPFLDRRTHGVFATRAPRRPNPIGISVVKLIGVDGAVLHIEDVDVLDGTPLLDIKPYVPEFDSIKTDAVGWLADKAGNASSVRADERFK